MCVSLVESVSRVVQVIVETRAHLSLSPIPGAVTFKAVTPQALHEVRDLPPHTWLSAAPSGPLSVGRASGLSSMPRGRPPKPGSPRTLAKRADVASKKREQVARRAAGISRSNGRPRNIASPQKAQWCEQQCSECEQQLASSHVATPYEHHPLATPPRAGVHPTASPPTTRSRRCLICYEQCVSSFMPCCAARLHRRCLASNFSQDPTRSSTGNTRWLVGREDPNGQSQPIPLATTHLCPHCKTPVASTRVLLSHCPSPEEVRAYNAAFDKACAS